MKRRSTRRSKRSRTPLTTEWPGRSSSLFSDSQASTSRTLSSEDYGAALPKPNSSLSPTTPWHLNFVRFGTHEFVVSFGPLVVSMMPSEDGDCSLTAWTKTSFEKPTHSDLSPQLSPLQTKEYVYSMVKDIMSSPRFTTRSFVKSMKRKYPGPFGT